MPAKPNTTTSNDEDRKSILSETPGSGPGPYPVMVYIPAGEFMWGSSNDLENLDAPPVPAASNVIVVTLGYRLGIFGWMGLDEFRGEIYSQIADHSTS